jgi:adenosine deaminase
MQRKLKFFVHGTGNTIHARAVGRLLKSYGCSECVEGADIVIVHHNGRPEISPFDKTSGAKRKILIWTGEQDDKYRMFAPAPCLLTLVEPNWQREEIFAWLEDKSPLPTLANCREALALALGCGRLETLDTTFLLGQGISLNMYKQLLGAKTSPSFYYLLSVLCAEYDVDQHNTAKQLNCCFVKGRSSNIDTVANNFKYQFFLGACEDLRQTLANVPRTTDDNRKLILLIDDNPHEYSGFLKKIQSMFLKEYRIVVWNPMAPTNGAIGTQLLTLSRLIRYESSDSDHAKTLETLQLPVTELGIGGEPTYRDLKELVPLLRFILVDQLYKVYGGKDRFLGPAIVRGLCRLVRDLPSSIVSGGSLPEVIAVSRTSDPNKIQDVLRAGARGYVLKTRLLGLPSVLASVSRPVTEPNSSFHRNFRVLYELPNETVGLLRSVRIPRITFQQVRDASPGNEPEWLKSWFARLLRAVPKTDLHVHVGSCMSPEFLVVASLVGLLRKDSSIVDRSVIKVVRLLLGKVLSTKGGNWLLRLSSRLNLSPASFNWQYGKTGDKDWICGLAIGIKKYLVMQFKKPALYGGEGYQTFRSVLHAALGIRDRLTPEEAIGEIERLPDLKAALFAVRYSKDLEGVAKHVISEESIIKIYLLVLAGLNMENHLRANFPIAGLQTNNIDLLDIFRGESSKDLLGVWDSLHELFYSEEDSEGVGTQEGNPGLSIKAMRDCAWRMPHDNIAPLSLNFFGGERLVAVPDEEDFKPDNWTFEKHPIQWTLSTGLRSKNLIEYLQGCEFSGAEHLRHPWLMHLYAQQTIVDFIRKGVFYAELRGSPDGYIDAETGFQFVDACRCFVEAFCQAQSLLYREYQKVGAANRDVAGQGQSSEWIAGLLGQKYKIEEVRSVFHESISDSRYDLSVDDFSATRSLPCKVSIILVGKRHKPSRQMILEAAASAVLRPTGENPVSSVRDFVRRELAQSRIVGFDLAGNEVGNPPTLFIEEFRRLSRLHIPLTVHAGENESARFIEDAILALGARRIGHGLSLEEDPGLMARVREDRICVELCPVSNHQTSSFGPPEDGRARHYPLKRLLAEGIMVTLNTDNPIISSTNAVREFFQASYAFDALGMSLWDALRLVRFGYVASFLPLPERRAMLELVSQYLFDLLTDPKVLKQLKIAKAWQDGSREKA